MTPEQLNLLISEVRNLEMICGFGFIAVTFWIIVLSTQTK
jgi:hypothetical protein